MTNQEKRTKSGELILGIVKSRTATTAKEVEKQTKLPHEEVVATFKELENVGMGRFIVGRRGYPSRFVRFDDKRTEDRLLPLDVTIKNVYDDGRIDLHFSTDMQYLTDLLERIKSAGIAHLYVDLQEGKPVVVVTVPNNQYLGPAIKALRGPIKDLS